MANDCTLVKPSHIFWATRGIQGQGIAQALADLFEREPALASFVNEQLTTTIGRLALAGAPQELLIQVHQETLNVTLVALRALRKGHYQLWKDMVAGSLLAQLDPSLSSPRSPRPRPRDPGAGSGDNSP